MILIFNVSIRSRIEKQGLSYFAEHAWNKERTWQNNKQTKVGQEKVSEKTGGKKLKLAVLQTSDLGKILTARCFIVYIIVNQDCYIRLRNHLL